MSSRFTEFKVIVFSVLLVFSMVGPATAVSDSSIPPDVDDTPGAGDAMDGNYVPFSIEEISTIEDNI